MRETERRFLEVPLRASMRSGFGGKRQRAIEGLAAIYGEETNLGFFREVIEPGAFRRVLSESPDVVGAFNHNWDKVLGRTTAGTLRLTEAARGLHYAVDVNEDDPEAMSVYAKVQRGDIRQSSFAFTVRKERWTDTSPAGSSDLPLRTIVEIDQLFDVSPVTFPAYPQTSASVSSKAVGFGQALQAARAPAAGGVMSRPDLGVVARQKARRRALALAEAVPVRSRPDHRIVARHTARRRALDLAELDGGWRFKVRAF